MTMQHVYMLAAIAAVSSCAVGIAVTDAGHGTPDVCLCLATDGTRWCQPTTTPVPNDGTVCDLCEARDVCPWFWEPCYAQAVGSACKMGHVTGVCRQGPAGIYCTSY
jgi:hypothetical protein